MVIRMSKFGTSEIWKKSPLVPVESVLNNGVFSIGAAAVGI